MVHMLVKDVLFAEPDIDSLHGESANKEPFCDEGGCAEGIFSSDDGSFRKWPAREIKPQVQDKAWDDYILRHAAFHVFSRAFAWLD